MRIVKSIPKQEDVIALETIPKMGFIVYSNEYSKNLYMVSNCEVYRLKGIYEHRYGKEKRKLMKLTMNFSELFHINENVDYYFFHTLDEALNKYDSINVKKI